MIIDASSSVLIVGAGPVGVSLALALVQKRIKVIIFEKGESLSQELRASTFHPRTLELLEKWGNLAGVLSHGHKVDRLQFWDRCNKQKLADLPYELIEDQTPFPFRLQCPQHIYTETTLALLQDHPYLQIKMNHDFLSWEQSGDQVIASFETEKGPCQYQGKLLCGADGANSQVRRFSEIDFSGMTYEDRFLLVGTHVDLSGEYPGIGPVNYMFDKEEWVIILHLRDIVRIVFQISQEEDAEECLEETAIRSRLEGFLGERGLQVPILSKSLYRVHQRVAEKFYMGRCVLLGDAAHINNPASGMGMNSGIQDAEYLAELLGDESIPWEIALELYEKERKKAAIDSVRQYSDKRYRDMSMTDTKEREKRNAEYRALDSNPSLAKKFLMRASMLENRLGLDG